MFTVYSLSTERSVSSLYVSVHQACSYWKASQVCSFALINEEVKNRPLEVENHPCGAKGLKISKWVKMKTEKVMSQRQIKML